MASCIIIGLLFGTLITLVFDFILRMLSSISGLSFDLELGWWFSDRAFWSYLFYILIASFVFSMLVIITDKFGRGVFLKLLIGRYKNPKEEWRIFMFLDLKSSTALAEQLGHFKYSQLIQDCF
ncbi:MAG: hypothetical protein AAGG75_12570 [Bacteroidota bacterium]